MHLLFRSLAKSPGYALTTVVTFALGIGAATAIFSVLHAVLLNPLPFREPERLAWVRSFHPTQGSTGVASATFADLAAATQSFAPLAMRTWTEGILTRSGSPLKVDMVQGTASYFDVFGLPAALGRTWRSDEALAGASPVVVLSYHCFQQQFGGDPAVVGQTIVVNDVPRLVIGVTPPEFRDPLNPATDSPIFVPTALTEARLRDRAGRYWGVVGRLRPGVTLENANVELAAFARRLELDFGEIHRDWTLQAQPLHARIVQNVRNGILLAVGAVACLLLITCANLAGLAVIRALSRRRELAIRAALGASPGNLVRQLLAENILLAAVGGLAGVVLARLGLDAILGVLPAGWLPRADEISLNPIVLAVSLGLTAATAICTGIFPAVTAARADAQEALAEGGRGSRAPRVQRLQAALVVAEIAFALVLLVDAALLGRSFLTVLRRDPGMDAERMLSMSLSITSRRYDTLEKRWEFLHRVENEVAAVPGVAAAGFTQTTPFRSGWTRSPFLAVGDSAVAPGTSLTAYSDSVSVAFFRTAGIPLLAGRNFASTDTLASPRVVIVSQATARRFFGDADPIGRFLARPGGETAEIVGVVADVRRDGLAAEIPLQVYRPLAQHASTYATLLVRTALPPTTLGRAVQDAVWRVDPNMPLSDVAPLDKFVGDTVTQPRLHVRLFALCSLLALALSAIGLHGVVAYGVAQRLREFGIRAALGATPAAVLRQVLRESSRLIAVGLVLGLAVAFASGRALQGLVYDVPLYDPVIFGVVMLALVAVALLACLLPARRAMHADPIVALRAE